MQKISYVSNKQTCIHPLFDSAGSLSQPDEGGSCELSPLLTASHEIGCPETATGPGAAYPDPPPDGAARVAT